MLLDRRCVDGGWNYGVREALGRALPSYPETTGLALVGLAGHPDPTVRAAAERAGRLRVASRTALGKAWLKLAQRLWGLPAEDEPEGAPVRDVLLAALEVLAWSGGNWGLLTEADRG
jgi:hypothetical protein